MIFSLNEKAGELKALNLLRIPLLVGVVFIQSNMVGEIGPAYDSYALFADFLWWFDSVYLSTCVPTFFLISGYLFFRGETRLDAAFYRNKYLSRWRSLAVPYILWNLLGLGIVIFKASPLGGFYAQTYAVYWPANQPLGTWLTNIAAGFIAELSTSRPYDFPLWFIRDLIGFVIISPVIGYALRRFGRWSLAVIVAACLTIDHFIDLNHFELLVYFSIGAWYSYYGSLKVSRDMIIAAVATASTCVAALYCTEMPSFAANIVLVLKNISIALLEYRLAVWLIERGTTVSGKVRNAAFFVYAFHGLYCSAVGRLLVRFLPSDTSAACFVLYLTRFSVLVATSVAAYWVLTKIAPRLTSILCGGR